MRLNLIFRFKKFISKFESAIDAWLVFQCQISNEFTQQCADKDGDLLDELGQVTNNESNQSKRTEEKVVLKDGPKVG